MDPERLNAKIFRWSQCQGNRQCKSWWYRYNIQQKLREFNLGSYIETPNKRLIQQNLEQAMSDNMENTWVQELNRHSASIGTGRTKLRTFKCQKLIGLRTQSSVAVWLPFDWKLGDMSV